METDVIKVGVDVAGKDRLDKDGRDGDGNVHGVDRQGYGYGGTIGTTGERRVEAWLLNRGLRR